MVPYSFATNNVIGPLSSVLMQTVGRDGFLIYWVRNLVRTLQIPLFVPSPQMRIKDLQSTVVYDFSCPFCLMDVGPGLGNNVSLSMAASLPGMVLYCTGLLFSAVTSISSWKEQVFSATKTLLSYPTLQWLGSIENKPCLRVGCALECTNWRGCGAFAIDNCLCHLYFANYTVLVSDLPASTFLLQEMHSPLDVSKTKYTSTGNSV